MPSVLLLGHPVAHSLSPIFQRAGFEAAHLHSWTYDTRDVEGPGMRQAAAWMRNGTLAGANITLPHKPLAAELADIRTPLVDLCGAANTWWRDARGRLCADNTDVWGVQSTVQRLGVPRGTAVVLGAGGSARAAVVALAETMERVVVVNRTLATARDLCTALYARDAIGPATLAALAWPHGPRDAADLAEVFAEASLVVHATPLGTAVQGDPVRQALAALPWAALSPVAAVFDLSYSRKPTPFVQAARAAGFQASDGAWMLVEQGAASFERWTGQSAPRSAMVTALQNATGRSDLLRVPAVDV